MPELNIGLLCRLAVCFALGSIPFAVMSMWGTGVDITKFGSGNPGFNNVLRYSKWRAMLCLAGDAGKGYAAVWLCSHAGEPVLLGWIFGIFAVLGHSFSPWLGIQGGKGNRHRARARCCVCIPRCCCPAWGSTFCCAW